MGILLINFRIVSHLSAMNTQMSVHIYVNLSSKDVMTLIFAHHKYLRIKKYCWSGTKQNETGEKGERKRERESLRESISSTGNSVIICLLFALVIFVRSTQKPQMWVAKCGRCIDNVTNTVTTFVFTCKNTSNTTNDLGKLVNIWECSNAKFNLHINLFVCQCQSLKNNCASKTY